jgi:6-phosphogluconolactonase
MPVDLPTANDAALFYESLLKSQFDGPWPRFDLILLGLGADGHTASLFPNSSAIYEQRRWVIATEHPQTSQPRLSLTLPVLNHARKIYFLVKGKDKAEALKRATTDPPDPDICPASAVRPIDGELSWWADWEAAQLIS